MLLMSLVQAIQLSKRQHTAVTSCVLILQNYREDKIIVTVQTRQVTLLELARVDLLEGKKNCQANK